MYAIVLGVGNLVIGMGELTLAFLTALLLCQIPLIDNDHDTLGLLLNLARDMRVLSGQSFSSIDEQDGYIAAFNGPLGAQHAELLDPLADTSPAANTGC